MNKKVEIIGAGLAGLLCAYLMGKNGYQVTVHERQEALPNNHSAVLRFRSDIVSKLTGIPFKKVNVIRCVHPYQNPAADAIAYSTKCNGIGTTDRSITNLGSEPVQRYIAPGEFINLLFLLCEKLRVEFSFGKSFEPKEHEGATIISTVPMPVNMGLFGKNETNMGWNCFRSKEGVALTFDVKGMDAYASVYVPEPACPFYRVSITGNKVIAEASNNSFEQNKDYIRALIDAWENGSAINPRSNLVSLAANYIGIDKMQEYRFTNVELKETKYNKIMPVDRERANRFMLQATLDHSVYSLGRFATWRPGLLLDDVAADINKIMSWIENGHYELLRTR